MRFLLFKDTPTYYATVSRKFRICEFEHYEFATMCYIPPLMLKELSEVDHDMLEGFWH